MGIFTDLPLYWFLLLGVLMAGYAVLDGFDLGVGILHLFSRGDKERRIMMQSIGPLWDGNEVWLVTFGGAMFAAFPDVYATTFSGFYLAFMALLCCLIFRAVSLEFRSKRPERWWRGTWDTAFFLSSFTASFLYGVAVGNIIQGLPIGGDREFQGNILDLLSPYPLIVGAMTVSLFAMHGAIYVYIKTEDELRVRARAWIWRAYAVFVVMYIITSVATLILEPHVTQHFNELGVGWFVVALTILAIANIPRAIKQKGSFYAFFSSGAVIVAFVFLLGAAIFPNMLRSSISPDFNLTIYNASSSEKTLGIMQIMSLLGMPFVLAYTATIYWVFRGKVQFSDGGY